jgi:hypothetical protein
LCCRSWPGRSPHLRASARCHPPGRRARRRRPLPARADGSRGITHGAAPQSLQVCLGQFIQAHAGDPGVRIRHCRLGVLDRLEQAPDSAREPFGPPRGSRPSAPVGSSSNQRAGGKPIALALAASLSIPGLSIRPLRRLVTWERVTTPPWPARVPHRSTCRRLRDGRFSGDARRFGRRRTSAILRTGAARGPGRGGRGEGEEEETGVAGNGLPFDDHILALDLAPGEPVHRACREAADLHRLLPLGYTLAR